MKLRFLVLVAIGGVFLLGAGSATALTRYETKVTLDSSVPVGNGFFVDSGRVIEKPRCQDLGRPVRLIGVKADGTTRLLDWTLTSLPGDAWATNSRHAGFARVAAKVGRSNKHGPSGHQWICTGASVQVFPSSAP